MDVKRLLIQREFRWICIIWPIGAYGWTSAFSVRPYSRSLVRKGLINVLGSETRTVLVTGAAGYIGSVCCEILLDRGFQVIAYDNLSEGVAEAVPPRAEFVVGDVGDEGKLGRVFSSRRVDAVMHFAALACIEPSMKDP